MAQGLEAFKVMITAQIFWSFVFTLLVYTLPGADQGQLALITMHNGTTELATIGDQFESAVTNQTNIPIVEIGALLFYSANSGTTSCSQRMQLLGRYGLGWSLV